MSNVGGGNIRRPNALVGAPGGGGGGEVDRLAMDRNTTPIHHQPPQTSSQLSLSVIEGFLEPQRLEGTTSIMSSNSSSKIDIGDIAKQWIGGGKGGQHDDLKKMTTTSGHHIHMRDDPQLVQKGNRKRAGGGSLLLGSSASGTGGPAPVVKVASSDKQDELEISSPRKLFNVTRTSLKVVKQKRGSYTGDSLKTKPEEQEQQQKKKLPLPQRPNAIGRSDRCTSAPEQLFQSTRFSLKPFSKPPPQPLEEDDDDDTSEEEEEDDEEGRLPVLVEQQQSSSSPLKRPTRISRKQRQQSAPTTGSTAASARNSWRRKWKLAKKGGFVIEAPTLKPVQTGNSSAGGGGALNNTFRRMTTGDRFNSRLRETKDSLKHASSNKRQGRGLQRRHSFSSKETTDDKVPSLPKRTKSLPPRFPPQETFSGSSQEIWLQMTKALLRRRVLPLPQNQKKKPPPKNNRPSLRRTPPPSRHSSLKRNSSGDYLLDMLLQSTKHSLKPVRRVQRSRSLPPQLPAADNNNDRAPSLPKRRHSFPSRLPSTVSLSSVETDDEDIMSTMKQPSTLRPFNRGYSAEELFQDTKDLLKPFQAQPKVPSNNQLDIPNLTPPRHRPKPPPQENQLDLPNLKPPRHRSKSPPQEKESIRLNPIPPRCCRPPPQEKEAIRLRQTPLRCRPPISKPSNDRCYSAPEYVFQQSTTPQDTTSLKPFELEGASDGGNPLPAALSTTTTAPFPATMDLDQWLNNSSSSHDDDNDDEELEQEEDPIVIAEEEEEEEEEEESDSEYEYVTDSVYEEVISDDDEYEEYEVSGDTGAKKKKEKKRHKKKKKRKESAPQGGPNHHHGVVDEYYEQQEELLKKKDPITIGEEEEIQQGNVEVVQEEEEEEEEELSDSEYEYITDSDEYEDYELGEDEFEEHEVSGDTGSKKKKKRRKKKKRVKKKKTEPGLLEEILENKKKEVEEESDSDTYESSFGDDLHVEEPPAEAADIEEVPTPTTAVADGKKEGDTVSLYITEVFVALTVDPCPEEPKDAAYEKLRALTQRYYADRLKKKYKGKFLDVQVGIKKTGFGTRNKPGPEYNVYVQWDIRIDFGGREPPLDDHKMCQYLVDGNIDRYLSKIKLLCGTPFFGKTNALYTCF